MLGFIMNVQYKFYYSFEYFVNNNNSTIFFYVDNKIDGLFIL